MAVGIEVAEIASARFLPESGDENYRDRCWNDDDQGDDGEGRHHGKNRQYLREHATGLGAGGDRARRAAADAQREALRRIGQEHRKCSEETGSWVTCSRR